MITIPVREERIKIKHGILFVVSFSLLLLFACAWTKMTSVRDPSFQGVSFNRILVSAVFSDLELKQTTEVAFVKRLKSKGVEAFSGMDLFSPTREYTDEEIIQTLDKDTIDAVLVVALTDYWTTQTYIPETARTTGRANVIGSSLYYKETTTKTGGYYVSKPRVSFEIRLYDSELFNIAWIATSVTRGNAFAKFSTLINSLATKTINRLASDEVIPKQ